MQPTKKTVEAVMSKKNWDIVVLCASKKDAVEIAKQFNAQSQLAGNGDQYTTGTWILNKA